MFIARALLPQLLRSEERHFLHPGRDRYAALPNGAGGLMRFNAINMTLLRSEEAQIFPPI
jgi:hypothetical protein